MNAKRTNRNTKAPAARVAAKTRKPEPANRVKTIPRSASVDPSASATPAGKNKQARLISLLQAKSGATIDQMMTLTGWQAHTVRGTISGVLRKKLGLSVTLATGADGARIYRIAA